MLRHWDGLDERTWPAYEAYYAAIHPGEEYARKHPGRFIYYTYLCTPEAEIDRSEYYDWNMRERGLCYSLVGRSGAGAPFYARVPLHRPRSAGHPSPDEIALYERLFRHIERALALAYRLDLAPLSAPGADILLEGRPHGIVLLDRSGRVLFANRAARAMAALADGFALAGGGVRALRQGDDDFLQRLIGSAAHGGVGAPDGGEGSAEGPQFWDTLTFTVAGATASTVTNIPFTFSVDGKGAAGTFGTQLSAQAGVQILPGTGCGGGVGCAGGAGEASWASDLATSSSHSLSNFDNVSYTLVSDTLTGFEVDGILSLTGSGAIDYVGAFMNLRALNGTGDFGDTAQFFFDLPAGVSLTSASGVFPTGSSPSAVPGPGSLALLASGLLGLGLVRRRRRIG